MAPRRCRSDSAHIALRTHNSPPRLNRGLNQKEISNIRRATPKQCHACIGLQNVHNNMQTQTKREHHECAQTFDFQCKQSTASLTNYKYLTWDPNCSYYEPPPPQNQHFHHHLCGCSFALSPITGDGVGDVVAQDVDVVDGNIFPWTYVQGLLFFWPWPCSSSLLDPPPNDNYYEINNPSSRYL